MIKVLIKNQISKKITEPIKHHFQIFILKVFSTADDEDVVTKKSLCVTIVNEK